MIAQAIALNISIQPGKECLRSASYSQDTEAHEGRDADLAASLYLKVPKDGNGEYSEAQIHEGGPCYVSINVTGFGLFEIKDSQPLNTVVYISTFGDQHLACSIGFQKCDGGSHCTNKNIAARALEMAKIVKIEYKNQTPCFLGPMSLMMSITTASFGTT